MTKPIHSQVINDREFLFLQVKTYISTMKPIYYLCERKFVELSFLVVKISISY